MQWERGNVSPAAFIYLMIGERIPNDEVFLSGLIYGFANMLQA